MTITTSENQYMTLAKSIFGFTPISTITFGGEYHAYKYGEPNQSHYNLGVVLETEDRYFIYFQGTQRKKAYVQMAFSVVKEGVDIYAYLDKSEGSFYDGLFKKNSIEVIPVVFDEEDVETVNGFDDSPLFIDVFEALSIGDYIDVIELNLSIFHTISKPGEQILSRDVETLEAILVDAKKFLEENEQRDKERLPSVLEEIRLFKCLMEFEKNEVLGAINGYLIDKKTGEHIKCFVHETELKSADNALAWARRNN